MYQTILVDKNNHIATLTLNRPEKLNAFNVQMKDEIVKALDELEQDNSVRVVIMTGAGRAFSSGADISGNTSMVEFSNFAEVERILNFDKPMVAALNGYALGDGIQHALLCDMIVASEKASIGFIGARIGGLCFVAAWALAGVVGRNKAAELLFTCDRISAAEAYRIGLVNKVVPHEQLMPAALEMAEKILKAAPLSLKYTKRALRRGLFNTDIKNCMREGLDVTANSEDLREAIKAFAEKREAVFKGK